MAIAAVIVIGYGVYKEPYPHRPRRRWLPPPTRPRNRSPAWKPATTPGGNRPIPSSLTCPDQVSGNADAIMLVTYDVPNQKVGMLSIPRDTLVDQSTPKINSSLHGGIENLQSVVSDLVGYPIDFYINIDLDGFVELVDAVGGVDF